MPPLPLFPALILLAASSGAALAQTTYPLTLDNCGTAVTLPAAPQRVVAIRSTSTEMLLALGLGERIVGVAFQDGLAPEPWTAQSAALPVLAEKLPSPEIVLEAEPDLVYGGWESNFSLEGVGERPTLEALGVATYVSPPACRSIVPPKLTFEAVFAEIAEIGVMFDAQDEADALIAAQKAELAAIMPDQRGLTALWFSSGSKAPYVGAGRNAPQMMLEALGLENIMGEVDEGWISASWEAVVDADPDVIVLVDGERNSVEQKKTLLAENPITSRLDAVIHQRYLTVPFAAAEAGMRNVGATADMAAQLARLSFAP
jgi:iron complex transport system substrate-binding protein